MVGPSGETVFTRGDILAGQQVFLKYGLMENGTIWGHGAYLGPDFSAEYLHALALDAAKFLFGGQTVMSAPLERLGLSGAGVQPAAWAGRNAGPTDPRIVSAANEQ